MWQMQDKNKYVCCCPQITAKLIASNKHTTMSNTSLSNNKSTTPASGSKPHVTTVDEFDGPKTYIPQKAKQSTANVCTYRN